MARVFSSQCVNWGGGSFKQISTFFQYDNGTG